MRVLDLFSGIGAYSLGLERAGMRTVAFCEIDPFCQRVLRKHWPDVPIYDDVTTLDAATLRRDGIAADVIVAGWPCQDISPAGARIGLDGARSGLWSEVTRLAGELRPRFLVLENSASLLGSPPEQPGRDFGRVLGDLASIGFDAEWHCLPAAAFDAPHIRDRLWIVANANGARSLSAPHTGVHRGEEGSGSRHEQSERPRSDAIHLADAHGSGCVRLEKRDSSSTKRERSPSLRNDAQRRADPQRGYADAGDRDLANADGFAPIGSAIARQERHTWDAEPDVDRVAPRSPLAVDRVRALGNCNPPIIVETIGHAIMTAHGCSLP